MKASVFIATSVDGFIARENGDIDWLPTQESGGEDYGYQTFFDSVDAIAMGRNTYELVLSFGGKWPYGNTSIVVLTHRPLAIPDHLAHAVEVMPVDPPAVFHHLASRGFLHLYVDGGKTIQGFLQAGLIHEITLSRVPILLGTGIPLFGAVPQDIQLAHLETRSFANGMVQTRYAVIP